jgi:CRP-like cAMP-binding protein
MTFFGHRSDEALRVKGPWSSSGLVRDSGDRPATVSTVESQNSQIGRPGERTNAAGLPVSNVILLSASDSDYASLRDGLEHMELPNHLVLHKASEKLQFAYFPNRGLISLVVTMADGKTAEAGVVGKEGFTGIPAAVGLMRGPLQTVVQITGDGFRIEVGALQTTLRSSPQLQLLLSRFAVIQGILVAQTAACNRLHEIEQRLARWLLMTQDRVDSESLPITHDFLATMLGTNRSSVSLAAGNLQRKKILEYTHGAVTRSQRNAENRCYFPIGETLGTQPEAPLVRFRKSMHNSHQTVAPLSGRKLLLRIR